MRKIILIVFVIVVSVFAGCSEQESVFSSSMKRAYLTGMTVYATNTMAFDSQVVNYSYSANNLSVPIGATAVDGDSQVVISFNGTAVTNNGSAMLTANLEPGISQKAYITVSREGYISTTYSLSMYSLPDAMNAFLVSLSSADGMLYPDGEPNPGFVSSIGGHKFVYVINHSGSTAPTGTLHLTPTAMAAGAQITVNGSGVTSGVEQNFTVPIGATNTSIVVRSQDGSFTNEYTVTSTYSWGAFTTVNYAFNGGVGEYLQALTNAAGISPGQNINSTVTYSTETTITGVVTAVNVYMHNSGNKSFFIQDQNAGMCIFTSAPPAGLKVGDMLEITVSESKLYYGMPEVTAFTTSQIQSSYNQVFYKTGNYALGDALGMVYQYSGTIASSMDNFGVGEFSSPLHFHSDRYATWVDELTAGQSGTFYGPINFSYSLFRMEISSDSQIE